MSARETVKKIVVVAGLAVFTNFISNYCQAVEIVTDGKSQAKIVITADACRTVEYAAEELQTYLEKISGAKLLIEKVSPEDEVSINKSENYIFVGESPYTRKLRIDISKLKPDGFKIIARDNWLVLVGRDYKGKPMDGIHHGLGGTYNKELGISVSGETGTLYSVYRFLENHLGVRWYMPGELGEVVPKKSSIEVKNVNYQEAPDFTFRRLAFTYPFKDRDMVTWYRRAGFGAQYPVCINHSFKYFVKRHLKTHPEYFLDHGKAKYKFLALRDPAVLKQFVADIREYFDTHPGWRIYPVMPDDQSLDRGIEKDERFKGAKDSSMPREGEFSDWVWTFVNDAAKEIYKTHPDKLIGCCAYSHYLTPPKTIKRLNPNVAVMIAKTRANYNDPEKNKKINNFIKEWKKKCDNIYVWEYYNWYYCGGVAPGTPKFFPHIIAEDLKFLKGISSGEFVEAETVSPSLEVKFNAMTHLNYYVTARYFWDADQDIEELLSDYYEKFYGPAKDEMRKFYTRAEELHMNREDVKKHGEELVGYLEEAKEKAGDTIYGKRVDFMLSEASLMVKKPPVTSHFPCVPLGKTEGEVKEEGLAAYWKFDEGEGKITRDSSGSGNHGAVVDAKWLKCDSGASLEFDGKSSYVEIRYPKENLAPKRKITLMGWFYYTEIGPTVGLIWTHNYAYLLSSGASVRWNIYGEKGGASRGCRFQEVLLNVPGWNHIAATYDADKKRVKLYLNGELKSQYPFGGNIRYSGDGKAWGKFDNFKLYIGQRSDGVGQCRFKGRIDEVKIYARALSNEEIKAEFEKGKKAFEEAENLERK